MDMYSGFLLGLFSGFHCLGMCGPIAMSLPIFSNNKWIVFISRLLYNFGRILTYIIFGAFFGLVGNSLVLLGIQSYISVIMGIVILVYYLLPIGIKSKFSSNRLFLKLNNSLRELFSQFYKMKTLSGMFLLGFINGFLPCGAVYFALAGSVSQGDFLDGIVFMMMFGFGTIPLMLSASIFGNIINIKYRNLVTRLTPVFAIVVASIFILRGLNLGIPYISPKITINEEQNLDILCHPEI